MIRKMDPPLGWSGETLHQVALIARFHRGSLPHPERRVFAAMRGDVREAVLVLCGILRLANAFDLDHSRKIRRLALKREGNALILSAPGYDEYDAAAEKISAARHLLETACRLPIFIR
jgi:exopolyphosphatase/guanosine-5'-triphosphate,3'-diphosphate pyrophosphatase